MRYRYLLLAPVAALALLIFPDVALAHGVTGRDAAFVQSINGPAAGPFMYLGAKHMVTGYDHLLFLVGVIFFPGGGAERAVIVTPQERPYEKVEARPEAAGTLIAPFSGIHGWYWQNIGKQPVTVTLTSAGYYNLAHEFRDGAPVKNKMFQ